MKRIQESLNQHSSATAWCSGMTLQEEVVSKEDRERYPLPKRTEALQGLMASHVGLGLN